MDFGSGSETTAFRAVNAPQEQGSKLAFDNVQDFDVHQAKIVVVGGGGGGSNTVNRLSELGVTGATTIALNTDAKHLSITKADKRILIGKGVTKGLGAGGYPEVGKQAALESKEELKRVLNGADLVFVTAGLGGGTGTGAIPVVARIAKGSLSTLAFLKIFSIWQVSFFLKLTSL